MKAKKHPAHNWIILSAIFIWTDPILAHLSNADVIRWPGGNAEIIANVILHGGAGICILVGIVLLYAAERS
jgi:hypothetical protein